MNKNTIADQIEQQITKTENDLGGWSDGIDGMIVDGGYTIMCDEGLREQFGYVASLTDASAGAAHCRIVADVWDKGAGLQINER